METFDHKNVTAVLPAKDGSCLYAKSRQVHRLVPHTKEQFRLEFKSSMIVRQLEFIASPDDDERLVQATSGGNWFKGFDPHERYPAMYASSSTPFWKHRNANEMVPVWSQYAYGPAVFQNAKRLVWYSRAGLLFCTAKGARERQGHASDKTCLTVDHERYNCAVRVPGTSTIVTVGTFYDHSSRFGKYSVRTREFDAAVGKFTGDADREIAEMTMVWPHFVKTAIGSIVVYTTKPQWALETLPGQTWRSIPEWYPDLKTAVNEDNPKLRASILADKAAWVGLDHALYYRTAQTGKLRRFRPDSRRKVKGCAFSPDGQTLWAFDSACIFRVDVDE